MAFTIPFGLVFELPVIVFFLAKMGMVTSEAMARNRKYAILVIFILAAALTPGPDPISQMMMGIPVYFLYEISVLVARLARPNEERKARRGFFKKRSAVPGNDSAKNANDQKTTSNEAKDR
jgi:sec-independent protein translocase protein TatC